MKKLVIALQSLFSRKRLSGKNVFLRPPKRRDAIKWQKKAIELADESSRKELRERLKLYQSETPYHE